MNQEKIGKFISECRKNKKMTQEDLASKLNVTDRAVSHWENGRRLPDYSIVQDLCQELNISINEFFAGKKLDEKDYKNVADENMTNMVNKLKVENNKFEKKMIALLIISTLLTMIILLLLPLNSYKDIIVFIMVTLLAVISNTINIVAMSTKNK